MTREQILNTVREMLEMCDSAIPWNDVIEYIDGAIGELVEEEIAAYIEKHDMYG
jgi:hypothetical protein